jgi:hypothetical protein
MLSKLKAFLRWVIREVRMKAEFLVALGSMFIPLGFLFLLEKPEWGAWAIIMIVVGIISVMASWGYVIASEKREKAEATERIQQIRNDEKRRQREHRENLIMLAELANRHGMSTPRLLRLIERLREQEGDSDERDNL